MVPEAIDGSFGLGGCGIVCSRPGDGPALVELALPGPIDPWKPFTRDFCEDGQPLPVRES
jgi:hypothetical protein